MTFLSKYDKVLTQKLNSFKKFLNTREYLIIMKQLELLIKEDSYNSSNACIYKSIQTELVNKIENRYKESQKLISKDIYCKDSGNYSEISNQLDKLSMLLQLSHVIDKNKKISDPMQVILKTQDSIKKYILIVSQYKIIQDNYNNIDKIKSLKEYTNKKSNKIFKKIEHEVKCYKKSKDLFNRDL
jgi:predicted S18 family serine protease